jgi:1-acyl-sn-glycerol-3-phosphate acyltransferase
MNWHDNPLGDRLSRIVCFPYFAFAHRFRWSGAGHLPREGAAIVAANHQSYYDPVLISLAARRRITYLALEQYFDYPLLGRLMRHFGALPVDPENPKPGSLVRMMRTLKAGQVCGIFPEGGRSHDGLPIEPRPGLGALALRAGVPVVPAALWGAHRAWPPGQLLPRPETIRLRFLPPIRPSDFPDVERMGRGPARAELTRMVMCRIADGLGELAGERVGRAARERMCGVSA